MLVDEFDQNQVMRIQDNSSKTRLSILFYCLPGTRSRSPKAPPTCSTVFEDSMPAAEDADRLEDRHRRRTGSVDDPDRWSDPTTAPRAG